MPDHDLISQKKQEKANQNKHFSKLNPQPLSQILIDRNISSDLGPTPFNPPIQKHTTLLSSASPTARVNIARQLQQTYGNQYVQRLIKSMNIQAKLTVGAADDTFEQEADTVADQVMKMQGVPSTPTSPDGYYRPETGGP
jgi:hypothetical protein